MPQVDQNPIAAHKLDIKGKNLTKKLTMVSNIIFEEGRLL